MIAHPGVGGKAVRIRLSNRFGHSTLTFDHVTVARRTVGAQVDPASIQDLTFDGHKAGTAEPGQDLISDPLPFKVRRTDALAVSMFVASPNGLPTQHWIASQTGYVGPMMGGDRTRRTDGAAFPSRTTSMLYLAGVDVLADPRARSIVTFGDSITDGVVATNMAYFPEDPTFVDAQRSYPQVLQRRFIHAQKNAAVLDAGISGNRLLAGPLIPQFGPSGLSRLDQDVLALSGVTDVILLEGINDLGYPPFADAGQLIRGLQTATAKLRAQGIRVHLGTILPASRSILDGTLTSPASNSERQKVNAWIRTQRQAGVIDFDAVLRDPQNPAVVRADLIGPDNLHPNATGYEAMANVVPLSTFRQRCSNR